MLWNVQFKFGGFSFLLRCIQLLRVVDDFGLLQHVKYSPFKVLMGYRQPWSSPLHMKLRRYATDFFAYLTHTTPQSSDRYSVISKGASIVLLLVYCSYLYFHFTVRGVHRVTNLLSTLFFSLGVWSLPSLITVNSIYGNFGTPPPSATTEEEKVRLEES